MSQRQFTSKRILFVDDEPWIRKSSAGIFKQLGNQVTSAATGREALESLEGESFDLAFLDLHLPDMDGLELMRELKRRSPRTQIVILTADISADTLAKIKRSGVQHFMFKPVEPQDLIELVENLLKGP